MLARGGQPDEQPVADDLERAAECDHEPPSGGGTEVLQILADDDGSDVLEYRRDRHEGAISCQLDLLQPTMTQSAARECGERTLRSRPFDLDLATQAGPPAANGGLVRPIRIPSATLPAAGRPLDPHQAARRRLIVKSNPLLGRPDTSRVPKGSPQIQRFSAGKRMAESPFATPLCRDFGRSAGAALAQDRDLGGL